MEIDQVSLMLCGQALTEATVLTAAGKLEETTLLVFANDAMLDTTGIDSELPDALKVFFCCYDIMNIDI